MGKTRGIVIRKERVGRVRIIVDSGNTCDGCDYRDDVCRQCLAGGDLLERDAANPVGAGTGDLVAWELTSSSSSCGAAVTRVVQPGFRTGGGWKWTRENAAGCR